MKMTVDEHRDEVRARFKHYAPTNQEQVEVHEQIREVCRQAALDLIACFPYESVINIRGFSQVLTDLENAMMHANAAYARHKND